MYERQLTALLVIDPYNDFISEGGKIWPPIKAVAEANNCVPHMLQVLKAAREAKLRVFYAMHHLVRVIRRRVFDHRHFVAELGSIGTVASMQVCAIIPMTMS